MEEYLSQEGLSGRDLVLPQLGIPDFVDSLREVISPLRSGWERRMGKLGMWEKEIDGHLGLDCKMIFLN